MTLRHEGTWHGGVTTNFGGVDVVPLQGTIVVCYGGVRGRGQLWGSGRGAIAGCHCSVLWWGGRVILGWCHCRVPRRVPL